MNADLHGDSYLQCFGEREGDAEDFSEADVLSAVEFDHSGDYLATGDKGGRIVLFERVDVGKVSTRLHMQLLPPAAINIDSTVHQLHYS